MDAQLGDGMLSIMSVACFALARHLLVTRKTGGGGANPATFDSESYRRWRAADLRRQFLDNFDPADLKGRDVLDFGCGFGDLSYFVARFGVQSITGVELDEAAIPSARARLASENAPVEPRFFTASSAATIDLPDASMDVILCFDVLEHVIHYQEILREWRRVLRRDGKVFIWWMPWFHPYGHHVESLVPLPWAHVFFPEKALIETCARLYESPEFRPRLWDLDSSGRKKPNKWRTLHDLPGLNRLTIRRFEAVCRQVGLYVERRTVAGFGGSAAARLTSAFTHVPILREFFASRVIYELRSVGPAGSLD